MYHSNRTALLLLAITMCLSAGESTSVSQYGITWTFDKPCQVGQFITGDWWVVGPVTVVNVTPEPGPAPDDAKGKAVKSRYGATGMVDDHRLRNGSMVVEKASSKQAYDSRPVNFDPSLTLTYPYALEPGQSLISTVSNTTNPNPVLLKDIMWRSEASGNAALKSAAVLTCLDTAPPADAFRPPYAGTEKPIFLTTQLKWTLLPKLAPAGTVPDWAMVQRWFERPWLDHIANWTFQLTGPQENQANYGREFCRATALASLMLMLDVPQDTKRTLLHRMIQRGIDTYGLVCAERAWTADGGHWNGRKWPLLFAGLMLDDKRLTDAVGKGLFSEDQQTYYGKSFTGETALYQMVWHTGAQPPYEEKDPATWDDHDKKSEGYRQTCSVGWPGLALSALLMNAKAGWNHDAFFDYNDRWMTAEKSRGLPLPNNGNGRADPFVEAMWQAHRSKTPPQPDGSEQRKWNWQSKTWEANDKPSKP